MLSSHKIHIHKAQLSSHKIHICNAQLSSQEIHIHLLHVFLLSFAHVSYFYFMLALDLDFLWLHLTRFHWLWCVMALQVSLALLHFLQVVLASHARWRFSLSFALFENNVPQNKLWMKKCGFPMISWKLPHKDACCTLYSPASCKVAAYGLHDVAQ